jgi:hypothetical protein
LAAAQITHTHTQIAIISDISHACTGGIELMHAHRTQKICCELHLEEEEDTQLVQLHICVASLVWTTVLWNSDAKECKGLQGIARDCKGESGYGGGDHLPNAGSGTVPGRVAGDWIVNNIKELFVQLSPEGRQCGEEEMMDTKVSTIRIQQV